MKKQLFTAHRLRLRDLLTPSVKPASRHPYLVFALQPLFGQSPPFLSSAAAYGCESDWKPVCLDKLNDLVTSANSRTPWRVKSFWSSDSLEIKSLSQKYPENGDTIVEN